METLVDMLRDWDSNYWKLLAFIIALGAIAMALLQLINDLTPIRAAFHTSLLRSWIEERVRLYEQAGGGKSKAGRKVDSVEALAQLIAHATGGHWRALFGLAPPQLVAQINAAAQGAMENPEANYSLIAVLSQPADPQIPLVLQAGQAAKRVSSHVDDLSELLEQPLPPAPMVDGSEPAQREFDLKKRSYEDDLKRYMEARTRVVHRIQRNLDGMQITLGNNSALASQVLAILISIIICYVIVIQNRLPGHSYIITVLLLGISAGYVAPLLGDIVAAVRRLGRT